MQGTEQIQDIKKDAVDIFQGTSFSWSLSMLLFMQLSEETPRIPVTKPSVQSFYIMYLLLKFDLQLGGAAYTLLLQYQCKTQHSFTAWDTSFVTG